MYLQPPPPPQTAIHCVSSMGLTRLGRGSLGEEISSDQYICWQSPYQPRILNSLDLHCLVQQLRVLAQHHLLNAPFFTNVQCYPCYIKFLCMYRSVCELSSLLTGLSAANIKLPQSYSSGVFQGFFLFHMVFELALASSQRNIQKFLYELN